MEQLAALKSTIGEIALLPMGFAEAVFETEGSYMLPRSILLKEVRDGDRFPTRLVVCDRLRDASSKYFRSI